jgi:hypothetical protein
MAWFWLSVILWLTLAYYGVYLYLHYHGRVWGRLAGLASAVLFPLIGFLFTNNFSLMTNTARWAEIFQRTQVAGAPTGLALNLGDPSLVPRWLMMFGLALTTVAALAVVDAARFADRESEGYRRWALKFGIGLYAAGVVWFGIAGSVYLFGTVDGRILSTVVESPGLLALFAATAASPVLVWLLMIFRPGGSLDRAALWIAVAQYVVLLLNAASRQWVQDFEISRVFDMSSVAFNIQWSPIVVFLVLFVAGAGFLFYLVRRAVTVPNK